MTRGTKRAASVLGATLLSLAPVACAPSSVFSCQEDSACGEGGHCDPSFGYCTFPDDSCNSGQRFGDHAGEGLAGMCVVPHDGSGSGADDDGDTAGTTSPPATGDDTAGTEACAVEEVCTPSWPEGWSGPVLAITGADAAPACPAAIGEAEVVGHAGLTAAAAECGCDCEVDASTCPPVTADLSAGPGCGAALLSVQIAPGECLTYPGDTLPEGGSASQPETRRADAGCVANVQAVVPPTDWTSHVSLCALEVGGACAEGICTSIADAIPGAAVCIWQDGEQACPLAGYTEAFVFHRILDDTRGCSECTCTAVSSNDASPCRTRVFAGDACTGAPLADVPSYEAVCLELEAAVLQEAGAISTTIEASDGAGCTSSRPATPIGEATPTDAFTVCCRP